ncbi:MAG: DNA-binding protein [Gammaproteobacteria bacterium]|nr:DNA-binding protein [Gammaproteobacteria bacterium]
MSKTPEFLSDLRDHTKATLINRGLDDNAAADAASEICKRMTNAWGGVQVYFPTGLSLELDAQAREIYAEFNGHNHTYLAKKYDRSEQHIYRVVKKLRAEELARHQLDMFSEGDES